MKLLSLLLAVALLAGFKFFRRSDQQVLAGTTTDANIQCLFSRPLIIGASVSAGFGAENGDPGSVLAKLLNPSAVITNKAVSGATSSSVLKDLTLSSPYPSIILGFDLFFWDAVRGQCGESFKQTTKKFFSEAKDLGIPLMIGKIPLNAPFPRGLRLASTRPCTKVVNDLVEDLCTKENNCRIVDPKDCLSAMGKPQNAEGVSYFRDELHTSDEGNRFCAEYVRVNTDYESLRCSRDSL